MTATSCLPTCTQEVYSVSTSWSTSVLSAIDIITGEDALANLSVERTEAGTITGHVRIRSKTQGIALSLGDRITMGTFSIIARCTVLMDGHNSAKGQQTSCIDTVVSSSNTVFIGSPGSSARPDGACAQRNVRTTSIAKIATVLPAGNTALSRRRI